MSVLFRQNWLLAGLAGLLLGTGQVQAQSTDDFAKHIDKLTKSDDGLWTVYHNDQKLLLHLKKDQLNKDYIVITSIARGISSGMVLGGMSWGFGDDAIWRFKKSGDNIFVTRRNVRYKANTGTPEAEAVKLAYSDSVLYALPVLATADGGDLIDLTKIFMSDDVNVGQAIGSGFRFSADRSTWAKVKNYPKNIELQVAAVYSGNGQLETVTDPRGVQVNIHYSICELPATGYKTRLADDRVGYFLTVVKNFSQADEQHFERYINRWHLEKAAPTAKLSPPKEPIIFYMEKTVPIHLRPYVQAGIEEWNKAFEKIGFSNAIQVRQQREDDTWDPEDVRYNTFRWITAEAGFAMGPSRVNPLTGQILDADIIFDASFLQYWKTDYETFGSETAMPSRATQPVGAMFGQLPPGRFPHQHNEHGHCALCQGMQHQMSFSAAALTARGDLMAKAQLPDEFVQQALKEVVMHEVGHTLGLRHNFKASSWKSLKDIEGTPLDSTQPTVGSVMDYSPANIALTKEGQGAYYTQTIGPYDYWVIEYGYTPFEAAKEAAELKKIAARGAEEGLSYATDEDTRSIDSDPLTNLFDLGKNPLDFVERQMKTTMELLPKVVERSVEDGDGYQRARQAFGMLFTEYWQSVDYASRFPGGVYVNRDHKGDPNARTPFMVVEAEQQRRAMKLITEQAFAAPQLDGQMLNWLAASRWDHWGMTQFGRLDFPVHDTLDRMQDRLLNQLLEPTRLSRLQDNELKVPPGQDAYTLAEHLQLLNDGIFREWKNPQGGEFNNRQPYLNSFRRNLQRNAIKRYATLVTSEGSGPEDARVLARMYLSELSDAVDALLKNETVKLDPYSKAHLLDSKSRIQQVLNSELEVRSIQ